MDFNFIITALQHIYNHTMLMRFLFYMIIFLWMIVFIQRKLLYRIWIKFLPTKVTEPEQHVYQKLIQYRIRCGLIIEFLANNLMIVCVSAIIFVYIQSKVSFNTEIFDIVLLATTHYSLLMGLLIVFLDNILFLILTISKSPIKYTLENFYLPEVATAKWRIYLFIRLAWFYGFLFSHIEYFKTSEYYAILSLAFIVSLVLPRIISVFLKYFY